MIGQGVLLESLKRPEVTKVISVGRTPLERKHAKLEDLLRKDLFDWSDAEEMLTGIDVVFFCLGISAGGMSEADYTRLTYDLPMGVARVKGRTEVELQQLGFKAVYCFRPGYIQPMDGIVSKTPSYRLMYKFLAMVKVGLNGSPKPILASADINAVV